MPALCTASVASARPFSHCRSTVARWTLRLRAKASIDESSRCCRPTTSSPAAAWAPSGGAREALLARRAVLIEQTGEHELGRIVGQAVDYDSHRRSRFGKPPWTVPDVLLEPPHHDVFEGLLAAHLHAAGEAVRIEKLEERGEAVRVAVVRRRGEEETVLETAGRGRGSARVNLVSMP